jgi:HTH-type transcriptional regulator/antitoxin HigA
MTTVVNVLETADDHAAALKRIERLLEEDREGDDPELEALVLLVEHYERRHFPIDEPDQIDAIRFQMAVLGLNQSDVSRATDIGRGHISEILNRVRPLSLEAIRRFSLALHIPAQVLIQQYDRVADNHEKSTDGY